MNRRAVALRLVTLPDAPPYLAIDLAGDDGHEPERLNVEITDQQLADLLPAIMARLRDRLRGA